METVQPTIFEKINRWIHESVMIKLFSIGFLILILMIPQAWIESLIRERQNRADEVMEEVTSKWSGHQTITGPVLVIPVIRHEIIDKGKDGIEIRQHIEKSFFLPETLSINGDVSPEVLHRGIFDAAVYNSSIRIKATFQRPDFTKLNVESADVIWKDAHLVTGISDLRGINENPQIAMGGKALASEPSNNIGLAPVYLNDQSNQNTQVEKGVVMKLDWHGQNDFSGDLAIDLDLKGSSILYFSPVGKTTEVALKGPWADPAFDGDFLPTNRTVTDKGFEANWKILHYNRPFSQEWIGSNQTLSGADFGVRLIIPVDQYQKSTRTAKYGILVILLTFISLFMVEIMKKVRIHPFQYILVGAALIIYYSLLLSFSEHVGYDFAYGIASLATVILIGLYSSTFLDSRRLIYIFTSLLTFFYGFIFVIIQLQDYSLLLGSIGLFLTIGLLMYFSKGIKWYKEEVNIEK